MPEIVQSHIVQSRPLPQSRPVLPEAAHVRARPSTGKHPGIAGHGLDAVEQVGHRLSDRHQPGTRLAVPQPYLARRAVDVVPPQRPHLVPAATGQRQQPDRRHRRRPRRALRFGLVQCPPEPAVFSRRQEPLPAGEPVLSHAPGRIAPAGAKPPVAGECEHRPQNVPCVVCRCRGVAKRVVKRGDVPAAHRRHRQLPQRGQYLVAKHLPVTAQGRGLAAQRHLFGQVSLGQVRHRGFGDRPGLAFERVPPRLDPRDRRRGLCPRLLHREGPVRAQRDPARAVRPAALHHVGLSSRGVHSHPEAGQVRIEHHARVTLRRQPLHDAFGESDGAAFGHDGAGPEK